MAPVPAPVSQPRAVGSAQFSGKLRGNATVLDDLRQQGSSKLLFPRNAGTAMTAVLLNTAGGITGGDRFKTEASAGPGCHVVVTTQAAERAYRAQTGETGQVTSRVHLDSGARLDWLPQETLLYDGAALDRRLSVHMAADARFLMVEPVIFGRAEMGEVVTDLQFSDRVDLWVEGQLCFADRTRLDGNAQARLAGTATGGGARAMASVLLACPDADRWLVPARDLLPDTAGISLIRDGVLFARLLAADSYTLRQTLIPLIERLSDASLPRTWMI